MPQPHILHVVTAVDAYATKPRRPTGLWLSELTHAYLHFEKLGFTQTILSPGGAPSPIEPLSLKWPTYDAATRAWHQNPQRMDLLATPENPAAWAGADADAIYFTGGHGVMFDFPENTELQRLTREVAESGGVVGAVCHGYCGLVNTTLSDGRYLIDGRRVTGFSWREEVLAGVSKHVPFNVEELATQRGARYSKALLPFISHVEVDGRLVTGQNPSSASATAKAMGELLTR